MEHVEEQKRIIGQQKDWNSIEQHLCGMIPTTTGASVFTDEFHNGGKRQLGNVTAQR